MRSLVFSTPKQLAPTTINWSVLKKQVYSCGLDAPLQIARGKWCALVLWNLASGPKRFGKLKCLVRGISEKMLMQTLRELEANEVVLPPGPIQ